MTVTRDSIASGARVEARRDQWIVQSVTFYGNCRAVVIDGCGHENQGRTRTLLMPFDRLRLAQAGVPRTGAASRRAWAHHFARTVLDTHPFGGLPSLVRIPIELLPFQLEPALAILRHGRTRLLIADDVGLGKTIQAGILLRELAARDSGFRAIVVTPAGLREQWQRELREKFRLESTFADSAWLAVRTRQLPADVNPWALPGIYVASLDLVKRPEVLRALEDLTWDLIVVDEVHNAGPGTARLAAADAIASRSRRVVLLTATPPDADPPHFSAIADLGRLHGAPLTEFRRTRADAAPLHHPRKTLLLPVTISDSERNLHRLLETYTSLVWTEASARQDGRARLAAIVLRKRALSTASSLAVSVRRRLALLSAAAGPAGAEQLLLPWDEDRLADEAPDAILGARGLADAARERACLEAIVATADEAARVESKVAFLTRFVRRLREPVVIFTEYRDTLVQLASALARYRPPLVLHGEMLPRERTVVQSAFNREGGILLATDAASEGLNLHQTCRLVLHFELPWTPLRLEQRTGRVDRFGQPRRVHEVFLVAQDTAERLVLAPLLTRAHTAGTQQGRSLRALDESAVASALMDGIDIAPPRVDHVQVDRINLADEALREVQRLQLHRRLLRRIDTTARRRTQISVHLPSRRCDRVLVTVRVELVGRAGQVLHAELVPISLPLAVRISALSSREVTRWADAFVGRWGEPVSSRARDHLAAALEQVTASIRASSDAAAAREQDMVSTVIPTSQRLAQAGLFDRRAINESRRRRAAAVLLVEDAAARLERDPAAEIEIRTRIVAIRGCEPQDR
jgi:superfamily II DNA or RNA helicase